MSISDNGFFGVLIKVRLREEVDKVIAEIRRRESNGTAFSNANPNPTPNNTMNYQNNSTTAYQDGNTANYQNSNTTAYQNGNIANYQNNNSTTYNQVNQASILREDNMKVRNTLAIVGFVLSILSLLFSCVGALPGLIMYVIVFYCASQGMKSKYRGLAIATFVISALGILILLGVLALAMFGILFS